MYLTAQRVVSPKTGKTGINSFYYAHAVADWATPASTILDDEPGELVAKRYEVPPPGNRVRSFLDMAVPISATTEEVGDALIAFIDAHKKTNFPWSGRQERCAFRIGMEDSLASAWRAEISDLLGALSKILDAAPAA
jgi:hypothetical protein